MIPKYFSLIWAAAAPAVANHLWQSTVLAVIAGLLTLALRKNQARARYWLWLAASIKFLIPFSLLAVIGTHLAKPSSVAAMQPGFYSEVATVSDFLTVGLSRGQNPTVNPETVDRDYPLIHLLPAMLVVIWLCGFVAVLLVWLMRWRRMSRACRGVVPLQEGREVEALRRMESVAGIRKPTEMLLSRTSLEPGIFGIVRPVLVWPEGISERLDNAQLEAILAHEVCHVRRRDNLAALLHMVVEAIFWFHPLVWWMGGRLVEERERACDEPVLECCNEPRVYAESILKACEFCIASPLACVSGVTGADLKQRIVRIMTQRARPKLDMRRKLLLGVVGFLALAVPIGFGLARSKAGQANAPQGAPSSPAANTLAATAKFEVASIMPDKSGGRHFMFRMMDPPNDGRFYATGLTLGMLLRITYHVQGSQIVGGPSWINHERFDIQAKSDSSVNEELRKLSPDQGRIVKQRMLQALLADRFKLTLRHETKELPIYVLVVAKNGPKLREVRDAGSGPGGNGPDDAQGGVRMSMTGSGGEQQVSVQNSLLWGLTNFLSQLLGRTVLDETGLKGRYSFALKFTPDVGRGQMIEGPGPGAGPGLGGGTGAGGNGQSTAGMGLAPESSRPSIFTAIQQQLGLKLKAERGPVEILVIDHIEPPSAN